MKKMIKTALTFMLSVALLLSGCAGHSSSSLVYKIPGNGVVKAGTLRQVKKSGKIAFFKGVNDKISYEWTFVGPDIKKPCDVNLKVNFTSADEQLIRKQAAGQDIFVIAPAFKGELPGDPTLSVTMGKQWKSGIYYLYSFGAQNKQAEYIKELRVVNGSVSSFNRKEWNGVYFLVSKPLANAGKSSSSSAGSDSSAVTSSSSSNSGSSSKSGSDSASGSSNASGVGPSVPGGTDSGESAAAASPSSSSPTSDGSSGTSSNPYDRDRDPAYSAGHPDPVDNGEKDTSEAAGSVTMSIRCDTAVKNWTNLRPNKQDHKVVPADGCIFPATTLNVYKGETVYDLLVYVCEHYRIQMEHKNTPIYGSEYIQGINNLYEFDGGQLSGWMYEVDGWYPNYGVSRYQLKNGDTVGWNYTCDLGRDLGQDWLAG